MIITDLETTGLNPNKHQIISLGAVDYDTGETFYDECRIYKGDEIDPIALKVNGFTEERLRDVQFKTPKQLYGRFIDWSNSRAKVLATCNIAFDLSFLKKVHVQSGLSYSDFPFRRNLDLYSVAYCKLGKLIGLKDICIELGIEPEPEIHNALTGAKKAYECFKILLNK